MTPIVPKIIQVHVTSSHQTAIVETGPSFGVHVTPPDDSLVISTEVPTVVVNTGILSTAVSASWASSASYAQFAETALGNIETATTASYVPFAGVGGLTEFSSSVADSIDSLVIKSNFTGSFTGSFKGIFEGIGSPLTFDTIHTSGSGETELIIGNVVDQYAHKQTTIFKNAHLIISGNIQVSDGGVLILDPQDSPPTPMSGAIYYSSDGTFFVAT